MAINKNIALVCIAVVMTLAMWMAPESISAETQKQRLLLPTYNTNPIRTSTVQKFCAGLVSRADLIDTSEKQTAQSYKNALASQFGLNGNTFINTALNGGDVMGQVTSAQTAFGLFIGFFAVGLVILLLQWSFLCCCCCCPSCCPSKCCQKDENQQYTKCELYWPSIFLILLLLLIIIVSAIGLAKASTFGEGIQDLQCSSAILFDDVINGNVTADGSAFFVGVTKLISSITDLQNNLGDINNNMTALDSALTNIVTYLGDSKTNLQLVPKNTAAGGDAVITYKTQIHVAGASTNYVSTFGQLLGSSTTGGVIKPLYTTVDKIFTLLDGIKSSASGFTADSGDISTNIGSMTSDLNSVTSQITDLDGKVKDGLDLMQTPKTIGTLVINLIYGIALGLSVLTLLGVVLMTFCDKYKCRYLMYFSCVILFILGIIGFLLAIIFSIAVPVMYLLCQWLDVTITSAGFSSNTADLISDAQVQNILSSCLVGGSGDIMAAVGGASIGTSMQQLTNAVNQTNLFDSSSQVTLITDGINGITDLIDEFRNGDTLDITDPGSTNAILKVTDMNDAGFTGCANPAFDSFIPSAANPAYPCTLPSGATAVNSGNCASSTDFEANNAANCRGCIDTSSILNAYYNTALPAGTWLTALNSRYTGVASMSSCTWKAYFGNVWNNYYRIKTPAMKGIFDRWTTAETSLNQVLGQFSGLNTTMQSVKTTLVNTLDTVLDPQYGLIAGINCKIIGQDLQTVVSSVCVSNFNTFYITRLLMGIASFGILFAMCCIVCSGVRHFKHSERKDKISPNFFGDKNSFENTDAAFRP